jgi:hypothetical protein
MPPFRFHDKPRTSTAGVRATLLIIGPSLVATVSAVLTVGLRVVKSPRLGSTNRGYPPAAPHADLLGLRSRSPQETMRYEARVKVVSAYQSRRIDAVGEGACDDAEVSGAGGIQERYSAVLEPHEAVIGPLAG